MKNNGWQVVAVMVAAALMLASCGTAGDLAANATPTASKSSCVALADVLVLRTPDSQAVVDQLALGEDAIQVGQTVDGWKYICTARLVYGWVREESCK